MYMVAGLLDLGANAVAVTEVAARASSIRSGGRCYGGTGENG